MLERIASNNIVAKTLRIVLVFSLVFWVSFRVECLAFAALYVDDAAAHSGEELVGMEVYELEKYGTDDVALGQLMGQAGQPLDDARDFLISSNKGHASFGMLPSWVQASQPDEPEQPGDDEGGDSGNDDDSGNNSSGSGKDSDGGKHNDNDDSGKDSGADSGNDDSGNDGGSSEGASEGADTPGDEGENSDASEGSGPEPAPPAPASLKVQAEGDDVTVANFAHWSIDNEEAASLEVDENGVVTITGKQAGTVIVTCELEEFARAYVSDSAEGPFEVQFKVTVKDPYIDSLKIHQPPYSTDSIACEDGQEVVLSDNERENYGFWAKLHVTDEATGGDRQYESTEKRSLSKESDGLFDDLVWEVTDEDGNAIGDDVATIDSATGVFSLKGDGPVIVRCTAAEGLSGDPISAYIKVVSDKKQNEDEGDIQGASHPQGNLTVTIDDPYATAADDDKASEGDEGSDENSESGDQADDESADKSAESSDKEGSSSSAAAKPAEPVSKVFTANDDGSLVEVKEGGEWGDPLGALTETYTMNTVEGGTTTVEGRGSNLAMLLDAAGVSVDDQTRIESIDFISAESEPSNIAWHDLVSVSQGYIMIAAKSYVHDYNGQSATDGTNNGEGEQAGDDASQVGTGDEGSESAEAADGSDGADGADGADGSDNSGEASGESAGTGEEASEGDGSQDGDSASGELLDNTRFRILYQSSSSNIDPMKLRYINQIIVHMGEPVNDDITDPELDIRIDYVPVPYGKDAFLSAVPNNKVGASRFGYTWQISTNNGKSWEEYSSESVQTLRVATTDPPQGHIGHMFRVILETDLTNEDGSARGATSEAVTIAASDAFSIVLDYIPPIAGQNANFTSHLYNTNGIDLSKLTYVWEANAGDGWFVIPGSGNSPSWSTPTNAVDESAERSDSEDSGAIMTYIRVRVTTSEGKSATSNVQPLTVRVGEDSGRSKTDDINDALNQDAKDGDDSSKDGDSTNDDNKDNNKKKDKSEKKRTIKEIDSIVVEETPSSMADYLDGNETIDPTVSGDSPEVVINQDVTQKINEQNNAAKEKAESNTPGARWTELKTLNPSDDDVQRIFADNPFAPFAVPLGLGVIFAGGLEKFLVFRRQL